MRALHPILKMVPGGPQIWASGGPWERFFILLPWIYGAYLIALLVVLLLDPQLYSDPRVPYVFLMIPGLTVSYFFLQDAWSTPLVLNSRVLHIVSQLEEFKRDFQSNQAEAMSLVNYLDSLGHGGRWMRGNLLSLAYFIIYLAWGVVALRFPLLIGIGDGFVILLIFYTFHAASVLLMVWLYRRVFHQMVADAALKGFAFTGLAAKRGT